MLQFGRLALIGLHRQPQRCGQRRDRARRHRHHARTADPRRRARPDLRRKQADAQPGGGAPFDGAAHQATQLGLVRRLAEQRLGGATQPVQMQVKPAHRAILDGERGVGAVVDQGQIGQVVGGRRRSIDQDLGHGPARPGVSPRRPPRHPTRHRRRRFPADAPPRPRARRRPCGRWSRPARRGRPRGPVPPACGSSGRPR